MVLWLDKVCAFRSIRIFASANWQERQKMNPHQVPEAKSPSTHLVSVSVRSEFTKPLLRLRKLYLHPTCEESDVIAWLVGIALQHWPKLHGGVLAERNYLLDEDIQEFEEFHARRVKATWSKLMRDMQ